MLVAIVVILIIAAISISGGKSALQSARAAQAMSNLKETGVLVANYANDNNNRLPYAAVWSRIMSGGLVYFSRTLAEATVPSFVYGEAPNTPNRPLPSMFYDPCLEGGDRQQHEMGAFGVNRSIVTDAWTDNPLELGYTPPTSLLSIATPSQKVIFCSVNLISAPKSGGWLITGKDFADLGTNTDSCPDPRYGGLAGALFLDGHVEKLDVKNMDQAKRRRYFMREP
jgi:prepilin-type processing-associated H-X9-DG protein